MPRLYLAFDEDTCIAEIRPSTHSAITVALSKPLTKLPSWTFRRSSR
ncbi:hypothetical protein [Pseudarthrobacter oxydans]